MIDDFGVLEFAETIKTRWGIERSAGLVYKAGFEKAETGMV